MRGFFPIPMKMKVNKYWLLLPLGMLLWSLFSIPQVHAFTASLFLAGINLVLIGVLGFVSIIFIIAVLIFDWAIHPANFLAIVDSSFIYQMWKTVRDLLNIFFIMILMFSAFATVFQIKSYNYKNILFMLILMALLVNFSFPVSRIIIDASNVLFYDLINTLFPEIGNNSGPFTKISGSINMLATMQPDIADAWKHKSGTALTLMLISSIVFIFLFGMTLLMIAILMVIRIMVLAILVIFSPIGFVGAIIPGAKKITSDWWDTLFKQSFFAPIMMFMLYLAIQFMNIVKFEDFEKSLGSKGAGGIGTTDMPTSIISTGIRYSIPIVILWLGMIAAKNLGAKGADAAQKWAKKGMMAPFKGAYSASGFKGGFEGFKTSFKKSGKFMGVSIPGFGTEKAELRASRIASVLKTGSKTGADDDYNRRKAAELREEWKKSGSITAAQREKYLMTGSQIEKMAVVQDMLDKNEFVDTPSSTGYAKFKAARAVTPDKDAFEQKMKTNHINFLIEDDIESEAAISSRTIAQVKADPAKMKDIYFKRLKMKASKIGDQSGDFLKSSEFEDHYLRHLKDSGKIHDLDHIKNIATETSNDVRTDWNNKGYAI